MGHHTLLWSSKRAEPCTEREDVPSELYLRAKYLVPIFWLALFTAGDLRAFPASPEEEEEWPYLVAPREAALARLRDRKYRMFTLLPKVHLTTFEMFCTVLDKLQQPYLHCDSSDVGGMTSDPREWEGSLRNMIEALDNAPPSTVRTGLTGLVFGSGLPRGWEHLLMASGLDPLAVKPDDPYRLAGGYFGDMPWEKDIVGDRTEP